MSAQKPGEGHQGGGKARVFKKRSSVAARMSSEKAKNPRDDMPQLLAHVQEHPLLAAKDTPAGPGPSGNSSQQQQRRHPRSFLNNTPNTSKGGYQGAKPSSPLSKTMKIGPNYFGTPIPEPIMEDILFRFLYNIPDNEKSDKVRVCFQVEQAHWFYVDFYCSAEQQQQSPNNLCKKLGFREFTRQVFFKCDYLQKWKSDVETVIDEFRFYKSNVPTYGVILLDSSLNYVLLVQGYFASKNSWGFPKGKVNEDEIPIQCAIREVFEETGYDATDKIVSNRRPLQYFLSDTLIRLYIATDVPMDYHFEPHLRNEIRKITWFSVWDLPRDRMDEEGCKRIGLTPNNFYGVLPFVSDIQEFVRREQAKRQKPKITILRKDSSAFQPVVPKSANRVSTESGSGSFASAAPNTSAVAQIDSSKAADSAIPGSALDTLFFKPICPEIENREKQFNETLSKAPQPASKAPLPPKTVYSHTSTTPQPTKQHPSKTPPQPAANALQSAAKAPQLAANAPQPAAKAPQLAAKAPQGSPKPAHTQTSKPLQQSYTGVSFLEKFFDSSAQSSSKMSNVQVQPPLSDFAQISLSPNETAQQSALFEDTDLSTANVRVELCKSWKEFSFDVSRIVLPF